MSRHHLMIQKHHRAAAAIEKLASEISRCQHSYLRAPPSSQGSLDTIPFLVVTAIATRDLGLAKLPFWGNRH